LGTRRCASLQPAKWHGLLRWLHTSRPRPFHLNASANVRKPETVPWCWARGGRAEPRARAACGAQGLSRAMFICSSPDGPPFPARSCLPPRRSPSSAGGGNSSRSNSMGCAQGKPSPAWGGRVADVAAGQRAQERRRLRQDREGTYGFLGSSSSSSTATNSLTRVRDRECRWVRVRTATCTSAGRGGSWR
jgi:hypothetical protein